MKSAFEILYYRILTRLAQRLHFVRAGSVYHLASYHLRHHKVGGIVDGGAFDGKHSLYLTKLFPAAKIYAFEPAPDSFRRLCEAVRHSMRITPINLALAETEGTATININAFAPTNSLLSSATTQDAQVYFAGRGDTVLHVEIQTFSLDQFARENADFSCDLLKLDLQGYELHALRGAHDTLRNQISAVVSEVRFKPLYDGDAEFLAIDDYLSRCGFSLVCLQEVTPHPLDGTIFEANALWVKR